MKPATCPSTLRSRAALLGLKVDRHNNTVHQGKLGGPVAGAVARVGTAGEVHKRAIVLTVSGDGYTLLVEVPPRHERRAHLMAAEFNWFVEALARETAATD